MVIFFKTKFFKTKIKRFKVDRRIDPTEVKIDFDLIDNYKKEILKYTFTQIRIGPESDLDIFIQSRVQMFMSQTLLRSLFIKDEIVRSLNSNNFPAFYALVKSFLEIPAQLGYLTYILYENKSNEELKNALNKLVFSHKGGLTEIKGKEPINIMTMFDKLDFVLRKMRLSETTDPEEIKKFKVDKPMRTIYEDICNFGHPNFMAYLSVGKINKEGFWVAKDPKKLESYKFELYGGFYMHHFTSGIRTIYMMTSMINRHAKINSFKAISSPHLKI